MLRLLLSSLLLSLLSWPGTGQNIITQPDFAVQNPALCPHVAGKLYRHHGVRGGGAGTRDVQQKKVPGVADISACVDTCCNDTLCHVAMLSAGHCLLVSCAQDSFCLPVELRPSAEYNSSLVLVRPPSGGSWDLSSVASQTSTTVSASTKLGDLNSASARVCEVGLDAEACRPREECRPLQEKSRNGVCRCVAGAVRDPGSGACVAAPLPVSTPATLPRNISVFVENMTVTLPQSSVSLTVLTAPEPPGGNPYKYEWKNIGMPADGDKAVESDANTATLTLTGLVEGVYQWRVIVTSSAPAGYGETAANVTVLPATRINTPPRAVIAPLNQTVTLPTNKAIVDGSGSTDDTPLRSYLWELVSGPVGYQPDLASQSIITVSNLTVGNYTLRLTVTDDDGVSDSTTATIEVVKDANYPPNAVAGEDIVLYLPVNNVTLNGNQSLDDHEIVTWEWTKAKGDDGADLPADISGARTQFLTVSNLVQGQYKFVLKVTDADGKSDEDDVKVYVKPPTNLPPVAVAGPDKELSLPLPFLTLDGSKSHDDGNITSFTWSLQTAPAGAGAKVPVILAPEAAVTNVTGLGVGSYTFQLSVADNSGNTHSDTVQVLVKQDTNTPPVAVPGRNVKISLPVTEVRLDGSGSTDDLAIARWQWSRDPESLAAGTVVGNMTSPQLVLANLVPGTYSFNLQVADEQGLTSNKSVKVTVSPDPDKLNIVEVVLNKNLSHFTQNQKNDILGRIRLLSKGRGELSVGDVSLAASGRGLATLHFKVFSTSGAGTKSLPGVEVVAQLRRELEADPELLGLPVVSLDTLVCQNTCSGHGTCDQATRECACQPAWMENVVSRRLGGAEPNCDWSVVYVGLAGAASAVGLLVCCCLTSCRRKVVKMRAKRKYTRLSTADNIEMTSETDRVSIDQSESDSEEEILFESSKKGRRLNGSIPRTANGFVKNGKLNT